MKNVQKIKRGGYAYFSTAQITNLVINLVDARRNLTKQEFQKVFTLYNAYAKCKDKSLLNLNEYYKLAIDIIRRFDKIAPYEKYSGGSEFETSLLMEEIRNENTSTLEKKITNNNVNSTQNYVNYIVEQSLGFVDEKDATEFLSILNCYHRNGKDSALEQFDLWAQKSLGENDLFDAMQKISFLSGLLFPNGVLSKEESDALTTKYIEVMKKKALEESITE